MTQPNTSAARPSASNNDITDRLIYPLLAKGVAFIPAAVHPNVLTLVAIAAGLAASAVLAFSSAPVSFLICAGLLVFWIIFDSCDGIHARNSGQCSKFGSFLDHFGDAVCFFFLQAALIYRFDFHEPVVFGALLLRQALACWAHIIRSHAGQLYITSLGWSFEIYAYAALMVAVFFLPDLRFSLGSLPELDLAGNVLLLYYIAVPLTLAEIALMIRSSKNRSLQEPQSS